jgi:ribosome-binding factor A
MREVLAEELERLSDVDERLILLTITAVDADPDLRRAKVLFSSLPEGAPAALEDVRIRLQAALGRQIRMKRTPQLAFSADPAVAAGVRVEDILRELEEGGGGDSDGSGAPGGS